MAVGPNLNFQVNNSFLLFSAGDTNDPSVIMMASSICTLILDFTSEDALLNHPNLDSNCLISLSQLIARSLASWGQVNAEMLHRKGY